MKKFKVVFSLLMCAVMVFSLFSYGLSAKDKAVKAAADISTSNYKTWTAATLTEARDSVNKFLTPLKGADPERPYRGNTTWQEGSLAALDKVYYAAVSPESGISSDLARQQLIQTVNGLELYDATSYTGRNIALNDYPDENLKYDLAQVMSNIETGIVEGSFASTLNFVDYAGPMGQVIPGMTGMPRQETLSYVQEALKLQFQAMRMNDGFQGLSVNGYYSGNTASQGATAITTRDAGRTTSNVNGVNASTTQSNMLIWFGASNPMGVAGQSSFGSNPAAYVRYLTEIADNTRSHGVYAYDTSGYTTPVIILYSNYEFSSEAMKQDFLQSLEEYENSTKIAARTKASPVFIQVAFKRDDATNYDPMVDKIFTPARTAKGWRHIEVNSSNAGTPLDLAKRLMDINVNPIRVRGGVIDYKGLNNNQFAVNLQRTLYPSSTLTALNWNSTLNTNQFNFVQNTFGGTYTDLTSMTDTELKFQGYANGGMSSFDMTAANNDYSGKKMGDKEPAFSSTSLTVNTGPGTYNASPNLYVPLSDAAVELYTYNGSGSETVAGNYSLKDTVVSNTYQAFGGTSYSLTNSQLASKKYGSVLTQTEAKNALKAAMGETAYNKLDFTASDSLNATSLTVSFDASKNVYKIYAKEAPTESTITIEHWIKGGAKISASEQVDLTKTGTIDALANITPTTISGYTYVDSDSEPLASVTYGATDKTVKLYYNEIPKTSTITIEHWIKDGAKISASEQVDLTKTGTIGTAANITPTTISGYTYVDSDSEPLASVTYGATNKTVKLYYNEIPKTSTITIEHWIKGGAKISASEQVDLTKTGTIGTAANITPTTISGYTYVDSDSEPLASVTYGATNKTVKLYYNEIPKTATMTIVYRNSSDGTKIQADKSIEGLIGTTPTIDKTVEGYDFLYSTPDDLSTVKFGETTTVTLFYKVGQGKITVKYVDATKGTAIQYEGQTSKEFTGQIGTTANIGTPPAIDGYNFAYSLPGQDEWATLQYKVADQTVTLYYIPITEITLTIIFEKDNGEELAKFVKADQKIGTTIDLRNTYSDVTAKLNELLSSYELYEFPANDGAYVIPNKDTTVTYKFRGTLFLSSAPKLLEFGDDHTIMHYGAFESERPTYKEPLTVTDTRSTLTNWKIKAKLTEDMHSRKDPTFILTNVLYYQNGSENIAINSTSSEPIITGKHNDTGDVNVSKAEWEDKTNGFQFKLSDKQFRQIDDYDGTIQFTLEEAP
ncbi:MucBP domain-containing protein [Enterococcus sp. BWR-S5]|uniref:MucBP domain-containing protein n=1 Tax=Enterococcus sp. BWR-S5 TaxID=2787714 RepID=UPI001922D458|nr:MucBP domain-containing protein [Enterococcus sp. BWR-S5]MBL1224042.1 MucBP domain-containing protein [Enterococcus sp. BWR-S5]